MAQEKWLVDSAKTIDVDHVRNLKVGLVAGRVSIIGHDESFTRVEVHSISGRELLVQLNGSSLELDHAQLRWDNFIEVFQSFRGSAQVDVTITVPRDVALKFGVVSASTLISGLTSDANISSISGDVVVDGLTGSVQLNAVSGEVSVRGHSGKLGVRTISGDVIASGEITSFDGDTVSGTVFLDVQGTPDLIKLNTISGAVTLRLEDGVPAQYKINTVTGLQLDDASITGIRGGYTGRFGELDNRWVEFRANTVSGDISVLHQVTA